MPGQTGWRSPDDLLITRRTSKVPFCCRSVSFSSRLSRATLASRFAAERLAGAGLKTIIFDEKLAWEKPCGGGLTYKAYQQYPFLIDNDTPKKVIHETTLAFA